LKNLRLLRTLLIASALLLSLYAAPSVIPRAHAAGLLYVNPPTIAQTTVGSTVTVQVKLANVDPMGGWNIIVAANQGVLNPTGLTTSPNMLQANGTSGALFFVLSNCINGVNGGQSTGCSASDTPGTVHSTTASTGSVSGSGLLFTITYTVAGPATGTGGTAISITFEQIKLGANFITVTVQNGVYGTPPTPGFTISDTPLASPITQGSMSSSTVSLTSTNGFSGTVTVTSAVTSGPAGTPPGLSPTPNPVVLAAGQTAMFTLIVSTTTSTTPGTYTIGVTGVAGSLTVSATPDLTITVNQAVTPPDFTITSTPVTVPTGATGTSTISLTSQHSFSGSVQLSVISGLPAGATATFSSPNPVPLTTTATSTLTITTDPLLTLPGTSTITVLGAGTSGSTMVSHTTTFSLVVTPAPTFSAGKLHWTHHLSLSGHTPAMEQTWTAIITNLDTANSVNVQVRIHYNFCLILCTVPPDVLATTTVAPGATVFLVFNSGDLSGFVNNKICFTGSLQYGPGYTGTSPTTKSGCFAIVP
jgi:hypothetical protein